MRALVVLLLLTSAAMAHDEHIHGVNVPDWYDLACCNNRDCRPVEKDDEPQATLLGSEPAFKWHGLTFTRDKFKKSQDERYHVCINPHTNFPLCIYLPTLG